MADLRAVCGEQSERRSKQKETDALLDIESAYLSEDRERRIIDNDAAVGIVLPLIVSARIKRPYKRSAGHSVFIRHPVRDRVVNVVRSIAVVGRFLCLEFLQKVVIFVVAFLSGVAVFFGPVKPPGAFLLQRFKIKVEAVEAQIRELLFEQLHVEAGLRVRLVVCDPQLPDVLVGDIVGLLVDRVIWHFTAELYCCEPAAVSNYQHAV